MKLFFLKDNDEKITSLELTEQINFFREKENKKNKLAHSDLLKIIRNEFEEEINEGKISCVKYKDKKGEERPMFELTLSQAKQVLVRESKFVRRAIIKYIEKLEEKFLPPFQKELKIKNKFNDNYLNTVYANLKRCEEIETFVEEIYTEHLKPLYEHSKDLLNTKENTMLSSPISYEIWENKDLILLTSVLFTGVFYLEN